MNTRSVTVPLYFGQAERCLTLAELLDLLADLLAQDAKRCCVAYGMLLAAKSVATGTSRQDALTLLDQLAYTKAQLDSQMCHGLPYVKVTAEILFAAQSYADDMTIPCTEWPDCADIVKLVDDVARRYGGAKDWRRLLRNEQGLVIGVRSSDDELAS